MVAAPAPAHHQLDIGENAKNADMGLIKDVGLADGLGWGEAHTRRRRIIDENIVAIICAIFGSHAR
jgi:hypothetical protein